MQSLEDPADALAVAAIDDQPFGFVEGEHARRRPHIDERQVIDPYATLDVGLVASQPFPLDLLDLVAAKLDAGTPSYATSAR